MLPEHKLTGIIPSGYYTEGILSVLLVLLLAFLMWHDVLVVGLLGLLCVQAVALILNWRAILITFHYAEYSIANYKTNSQDMDTQ